jgi:hypothetical protein
LYMTEHPDLSGAVVDLRLGEESAIPICRRLSHRDLPFVVHTGYAADAVQSEWPSVPIIQKPAIPEELTRSLSELFRTHADCQRQTLSLGQLLPPPSSLTVSVRSATSSADRLLD